MVDKIDHKSLAIDRLATQFRESTNLINYIRSLLIEANNLEQVFCDILEKRLLDTAEGIQLDIIGAIVGQTRDLIDAEVFDYFGFFNNSQAQSFGSILDSELGGRFRFVDESTTAIRSLTDEEYRLFIRARIIRNSTSSTAEDIISQIKFVLDAPLVVYSEINNFVFSPNWFAFGGYTFAKGFGSHLNLSLGGDFVSVMNKNNPIYELSIGKILTLNEKSILIDTDIIPKTAGATAIYVSEFDNNNFFGFQGLPNSGGLGSISNPSLGGKLANLIF